MQSFGKFINDYFEYKKEEFKTKRVKNISDNLRNEKCLIKKYLEYLHKNNNISELNVEYYARQESILTFQKFTSIVIHDKQLKRTSKINFFYSLIKFFKWCVNNNKELIQNEAAKENMDLILQECENSKNKINNLKETDILSQSNRLPVVNKLMSIHNILAAGKSEDLEEQNAYNPINHNNTGLKIQALLNYEQLTNQNIEDASHLLPSSSNAPQYIDSSMLFNSISNNNQEISQEIDSMKDHNTFNNNFNDNTLINNSNIIMNAINNSGSINNINQHNSNIGESLAPINNLNSPKNDLNAMEGFLDRLHDLSRIAFEKKRSLTLKQTPPSPSRSENEESCNENLCKKCKIDIDHN